MKCLAAVATSLLFIGQSALAAETKPETGKVIVKANCTTTSTSGSGRRHACDSPWQMVQTTSGFVIAEHSLRVRETSGNGSEHQCVHRFDKYVEVIPGTGITAPTVFYLRAHARSEKGHWGGRGWSYCEATFIQAQIPTLTAEEEKMAKAMNLGPPEEQGESVPAGDKVEDAKFEFESSMVSAE